MAHRYLIDKILPSRQIHLIAGPSGIGKTRWYFGGVLKEWLQGNDVLGFTSNPVPTMYLAADRNLESLHITLEALNALDLIPYDSILFKPGVTMDRLHSLYPTIKNFLIDPISVFVPGHKLNDYGTVSLFLRQCSWICQRDDITIQGFAHATKLKEGQRLINPREQILGSAAWGAFSETMFVLNTDTPQIENSPRNLYVLPRNWKELKYRFTLEGGIPRMLTDNEEEDQYILLLTCVPFEQVFSRNDLLGMAVLLKISTPTFDRYLKRGMEEGRIERVRYGYYRVLPPPQYRIIPPPENPQE